MHKFMWLIVGMSLACNLPAQVEPKAGQWKTWILASAIYDSTVAAWDSKYAYMRHHPSEIDPTVTTVVQPTASPSYPSEHAVTAGAAAAVLAYLFPDQASAIGEMANQAGQSRILG